MKWTFYAYSRYSDFGEEMDPSPQEYIQELLKPLQQHQASGEYFHQHQALVEFDSCLRTLESRYADLYEQVLTLEKKLFTH